MNTISFCSRFYLYNLLHNKRNLILNRSKFSTVTQGTSKNREYVLNLVKKFDYENFLATLLIIDPIIKRSALTFRALNVELSQVLDTASQPVAVQGRYLFWSEVIDEIYSGDVHESVKKHPVAAELLECRKLTRGELSKRHFKKLIYSRNSPEHLTSFPFETVQQIQDYCEFSIAPVYYLLVESALLNDKAARNVHLKLDHIASHLARCQGISNILRGVAHNSRSGRCYISSDLLNKHQATHQDFLKCRSKKEVFDIGYDLASIANDHLKIAKKLLDDNQTKPFRQYFLPIILVEMYLSKLEEKNFDIFHKDLYRRDGILPFKLWLKSLKMRYM